MVNTVQIVVKSHLIAKGVWLIDEMILICAVFIRWSMCLEGGL